MGRMWSHDTDDARLEAGSRRMTDAEQALAVLGGSVLTLWALRHGRLLPSLVLAFAAPLVVAGWRKRWPAMLSPPPREDRSRLPDARL